MNKKSDWDALSGYFKTTSHHRHHYHYHSQCCKYLRVNLEVLWTFEIQGLTSSSSWALTSSWSIPWTQRGFKDTTRWWSCLQSDGDFVAVLTFHSCTKAEDFHWTTNRLVDSNHLCELEVKTLAHLKNSSASELAKWILQGLVGLAGLGPRLWPQGQIEIKSTCEERQAPGIHMQPKESLLWCWIFGGGKEAMPKNLPHCSNKRMCQRLCLTLKLGILLRFKQFLTAKHTAKVIQLQGSMDGPARFALSTPFVFKLGAETRCCTGKWSLQVSFLLFSLQLVFVLGIM